MPTKQELEERISSLEDTLEETRDLIDEVLREESDEDGSDED